MPPQQPQYLSTDPNGGQPAAAPPPLGPNTFVGPQQAPTAAPSSRYLSTDPLAGQPAASSPPPGRAGGGGRGSAPAGALGAPGGRGGGPGGVSAANLPPPPAGQGIDWREATRDLAGTVGATAAMTLVPEVAIPVAIAKYTPPGLLPWMARTARVAIGMGGAGAGGGAAAAATGTSPVEGAAEQAGYEALGHAAAFIPRAAIRRALASRVGRFASEHFSTARRALGEQLDSVLAQADAAVRGTKAALASRMAEQGGKARVARSEVRMAKAEVPRRLEQAEAAEAAAKAAGEQQVAEAAGRWPGAATPPPSAPGVLSPAARATRDIAGVVEGPARTSLDQLGQAVEDAAEGGPTINWSPIKQELMAKAERMQPRILGEEASAGAAAEVRAAMGVGGRGLSDEEIRGFLAKQGIELAPDHPLPGVLGKIMSVAQEQIPFSDAHRFKRLLDEAVNWESPARKQLQQITKGIRSTLRTAMTGHAPYDQATAAYASALPLFRQGYAKRILKLATDDPDGLARLVKPTEPTRLQMLKELLLHHAEEGGGGEAGRRAWNQLRSTVTHERFIKPGIEKFDETLAKADPQWVASLYDDAEGKRVLDNLKAISGAWRQAQEAAATNLAHVKELGGRAVTAARGEVTRKQMAAVNVVESGRAQREAMHAGLTRARASQGQIRSQVARARKPTEEELKFSRSSLARPAQPAQVATDMLHMAMPGSGIWKLASAGRLWVRGPKVADLIEYAAYSPKGTQLLVQAVTGPAPGAALAALARWWNLEGSANPDPGVQASAPPPGQEKAATPPPGPPRR